jgi:hypothetical protein
VRSLFQFGLSDCMAPSPLLKNRQSAPVL